MGGGTEREVRGEDYQGGGGRVGGVRVKRQLSLRVVVTSVVRQRMRKAPAVQDGRALPMGVKTLSGLKTLSGINRFYAT